MSGNNDYRAACAQAEARRARLIASAQAVKERVTPARLRTDVRNKVAQSASDGLHNIRAAVCERPIAASAAGIALIAWLARRPLWTLLRRLFVGKTDEQDRSLSETDNG